MSEPSVDALADGIGAVEHAKGYDRIVAGGRTLAYVNPKKGALQLDFHGADVGGAAAKLTKDLAHSGSRAKLSISDKATTTTARALLEHVKGLA
jgi:hypothetical protein